MSIILKAARPLAGSTWSSRPDPWMTDFKPSKVKITGVFGGGEPSACEVRSWHISGSGNVIGNFTGATGEITVDLTYGVGEYFGRIVAPGYSSISKIEFNEDPGPEPWYDVTYWGGSAAYWSPAGGSWNSEENRYEATETNLGTFIVDGGWNQPYTPVGGTYHYRPTKMRITGTVVGSETVTLKTQTGDNTIGSASPSSVTTLNLNGWPQEGSGTELHLYYLDLSAFSIVTKIEVNFPPIETIGA